MTAIDTTYQETITAVVDACRSVEEQRRVWQELASLPDGVEEGVAAAAAFHEQLGGTALEKICVAEVIPEEPAHRAGFYLYFAAQTRGTHWPILPTSLVRS